MRIVHISSDYPDPLDAAKPKALANLMALADHHDTKVVSLNRVDGTGGISRLLFDDTLGTQHSSIVYKAPPYGVGFKTMLVQVAEWIAADWQAHGYRPDLIHAHKLTVEGTVGAHLAKMMEIPLVLSIQGSTDLRMVEKLPWLQKHFKAIWHQAAVVYPFAPWTATALEKRFGQRSGPTLVLPCVGGANTVSAPGLSTAPVICTAFHLRDAKRKNAARLISAIGQVARDVPAVRLEVLGGGDAANFAELSAHAARVAPGQVRFRGAVPHEDVQQIFGSATAFALVSRRESFGLVFAEALMAGAPCLIPVNQGIDGYFEPGSVVLPVASSSTEEIAAGLLRLIAEEEGFKNRLAELGASGGLEVFSRQAIRTQYLKGLAQIEGAIEASIH